MQVGRPFARTSCRRLARTLAWLSVVIIMLIARPGFASPEKELEAARQNFKSGKFSDVIAILSGLLYPTSRLGESAEIAEAHLLLGTAYFETKNALAAQREWSSALFIDPSLSLEEGLFSTDAVKAFAATKSQREEKSRQDAKKEEDARRKAKIRQLLANMVVLEKQGYYVNFIPFGAGQFQNGDKRKAIFFLSSELALGGISAALYGYQVVKYKIRNRTVPLSERDSVFNLQRWQIITGSACLGIMAWGIIDALVNYQHVARRGPDPALLKELDEPTPLEKSLTGSVSTTPWVGPDSAGLTLGWEF